MKSTVVRARRESGLLTRFVERSKSKKECTVCTLFLLMSRTTFIFASVNLFLQYQMICVEDDGICLALRGGHVHDVAAVAQMRCAT